MRGAMCEWEVNLGEPINHVVCGSFSGTTPAKQQELAFLGAHSLFIVKESGGLLQQKRLSLGAAPACLSAYARSGACTGTGTGTGKHSEDGPSNLLVGFHDGTLHIYEDFVLVWAARAETPSCCLATGCFGRQDGLIVSLSSDGRLELKYLGTRPARSSGVVGLQDAEVDRSGRVGRGIDYDRIDSEHRYLRAPSC